ncbi:hypothetical protein COOONC_00527, partial [Cooperia oncophora]
MVLWTIWASRFSKPVSSGFDDVPVYVGETNRTFCENHMIQRHFCAEEVVPCESLTEEQFEELRKQVFELATLQVPNTLTPAQQYAARDAILTTNPTLIDVLLST